MKKVYPVFNGPHVQFIPGIPAVEQELSDKDAAALVATGAFTYDKPKPVAEPEPEQETE